MPSPWNAEVLRKFHITMEALYATHQNPVGNVAYRDDYRLDDETAEPYIMRFLDELQIADHVAFLAHAQEGAHAVSAVCVEERSDGLLIRLASNERPLQDVAVGLRKLFRDLGGGVQKGIPKDVHCRQVFENVLKLSKHRILQRIRPPWGRFVRREEPLWARIITFLRIATPKLGGSKHRSLCSRLEHLVVSMQRQLDQKRDGTELIEILSGVIQACAAVSYYGAYRSLEDQLRTIPELLSLAKMRDISQVDKLSRYYGVAKDLTRIARRPVYRLLFHSIKLEILEDYAAFRPPGAAKKCHIHAEVQLIFHYERRPPANRPARAIGCSKSACFLCDALIRRVGAYRISHAHRRLYRQWALPRAEWMTPQQRHRYRGILDAMTEEMRVLIATLGRDGASFRPFDLESIAIMPLTSEPTLTASSCAFSSRSSIPSPGSIAAAPNSAVVDNFLNGNVTDLKISAHAAVPVTTQSGTTSSVSLSESDLPFRQHISATTGSLYLCLDDMCLFFEFVSFSVGRLTVKRAEISGSPVEQKSGKIPRISVSEIPTSRVMEVGRPGVSSSFKFQLRHAEHSVIEIEMVWGVYLGYKARMQDMHGDIQTAQASKSLTV